MTPDNAELLKTVLTVAGGACAALLTSYLARRSQKESAQITLLMGLLDQVQEERDSWKKDAKQVPLWRRHVQRLRSQIYKLGGEPVEADQELEL